MKLPEHAVSNYSKPNDFILFPYFPQSAFVAEAAASERICYIFDSNPLVKPMFESEFCYPSLMGLRNRLQSLKTIAKFPDCGVQKFFNEQTYNEIMAIRLFLEDAPQDAINPWIRRLCADSLKPPNPKAELIEYVDIKDSIYKNYKTIFQEADPMKILIQHSYKPNFSDKDAFETQFKDKKVPIIYYSPYQINIEEYAAKNFLKMWFFAITKEDLLDAIPQDETQWVSRCKRDFQFLHKKLDLGGIFYIETHKIEDVSEFLKIALFYNYKNLHFFENEEGSKVLFLQKPKP